MTALSANENVAPATIAHPTQWEAFLVFAKIGLLSFGGPAGQIALMHKVLVEEKRWISEERFLHALNYCMLLPGPEAQQLATYIGWLLHGVRGGVVAGTLFIIPGFLIILGLSSIYALYQGTASIDAIFFGLKAAVLAVVIEAVIRVGKRALKNGFMIGLAAASFIAIYAFQVPFPLIILGAGLMGYFGARLRPDLFKGSGHGGAAISGPFLELREPEVQPGWGRAAKVLLVWGLLWIAPVLLLAVVFGRETIFMPIAAFFSQMAVVTFGGAYAVLSYVAQAAVSSFGWLRPGEMLDGLAMAETTPGPLILVLVYVGFLAAFRSPPGIDPLLSGVIGATLTTWVTFIPCFLWIFLGAPYIETLRANKALSGALTAITASVVGVILNLAIWFGLHVVFRTVGTVSAGPLSFAWPDLRSLDLAAALLAVAAAIAIFRLKLGLIPTLGAAAAGGLMLRYLLG
ncbi:chromate efflux transporter [Phreatobacter oligotrophus]|uniref:Chromate transporter n=1 Tax=Phreatobacter oligotrophus TaxID=1122261 RepID=A0A2T4YWZ6_9HYPH|nr:chromate efflux transporter [Phreatobacter oligotrophus]PTM49895.1 chromate transporter [Phreatobacter oligotrophus]